jgi:hypothetical protein
MQRLCKHESHIIIDNIWQPRYSTKDVLINVTKLRKSVEHYLIKFTKAPSLPGWYYVSLNDLARCKTQKNGAGTMIICPMSKLEDFEPIKVCSHTD